MAENSAIEWTDHTWSPWEGCTKVGPGCDHCYAEGMNRWLRKGQNWGPGAPRREYSDEHWGKPLKWAAAAAKAGRRLRVFPSVCDPFDNAVDPAWRARFWQVIYATADGIDWLLLTKRIGNVRGMVPEHWLRPGVWPAHVWLGATVVNQEEADRDIPKLLATPARLRFLSMEPLLGPVALFDHMTGELLHTSGDEYNPGAIDWVIVGGESGRGARPMHPDWARNLRDQCAAAGVPFLFKQWGEWAPGSCFPERIPSGTYCDFDGALTTDDERVWKVGKKAAGRLLDGRTHDAFPEVTA